MEHWFLGICFVVGCVIIFLGLVHESEYRGGGEYDDADWWKDGSEPPY